jgi:hypothetical protein
LSHRLSFWTTCPSGRHFEALFGQTSPARLFFTMPSLIDNHLKFCILIEEDDLCSTERIPLNSLPEFFQIIGNLHKKGRANLTLPFLN